MERNVITKEEMTIEKVVSRWDISEELKQNKIEILESWREKINNNEKFSFLLRICDRFEYYSPRLTAETYRDFFDDFRKEHEDFDSFLASTLFTPLRSRERMESSVDMFSQFRLVNNIDAGSTFVEGPITFIKKFRELKEDLKKRIEIEVEEKKELEKKINTLTGNLQNCKDKKIAKQRVTILDKTFEEVVNNFNKKYYYVRNIVIIDDFIGTGSSGEKLIKRIARELEGTDIKISFYLWILETSIIGKENIEKLANSLGVDLKIKFRRISLNVLEENIVFSSAEQQIAEKEIKSILNSFNIPRSRYSNNHALASFVNAPNNNLALLSNQSEQWKALFLRIKRVEKERKIKDSNELKDIMKFVMGR